MSGVEIAIIITGCVVSLAGVISATIIKLRCKSNNCCGGCSVTPTEILEHGDPSLKDVKDSSNVSLNKKFEEDLSKLEKIIEDSKQLSTYDESFSD